MGISFKGEKRLRYEAVHFYTPAAEFHVPCSYYAIFRLSYEAVIDEASWSVVKRRSYVMPFGTESVEIRRSVQHCCVSVHNVTFILGSCNEIFGNLDFVWFRVLLVSL